MIDPDSIRTAVIAVLFVVSTFDLGVAFLIRGQREATPDD